MTFNFSLDKLTFPIKKIIKYIIYICIIFTLMKVIPSSRIEQSDIFLIIAIIILCLIVLDNVNMKEGFDSIFPDEQVVQNVITSALPNQPTQLSCEPAINDMQTKMNEQLQILQSKINELQNTSSDKNTKKYMDSMIVSLTSQNILDQTDVSNIYAKLDSKLISIDDVINGLENLKLTGKPRSKEGQPANDFAYSELPAENYKPLGDKSLEKWDNEFSLLNTNRWEVPMPRPPVCINTSPCKVCPDVVDGYPLNVKEWDNSRKISNININKNWANKQTDVKENVLKSNPEPFKSLTFEQVLGKR